MDAYKEKLREIAYDNSTYESISSVATKYSLHIDQLGELTAEIRDILMGFRPSKKFTTDIMERLEIDENLANKITIDANLILEKIMRENMKPTDSTTETTTGISSLEKVGNFSIEESEGNVSDENTVSSISDLAQLDTKTEDKDKILDGIENPEPAMPTARRINVLEKESPHENVHTDPIIDHLLSNPIATEENKVEKTVVEAPKKPTQPPQSGGMDKYREPIE